MPAPAAEDRQTGAAAAARLRSLGMKEVPAGCSSQPSQPARLGASQRTIKKNKKKIHIFSVETADSSPAQPAPSAGVCLCPKEQCCEGHPSPPSITEQWRPGSWLGWGMLQQHQIPFRKEPGSRKKYFHHPKSKMLNGGAPAHCSLGSFV